MTTIPRKNGKWLRCAAPALGLLAFFAALSLATATGYSQASGAATSAQAAPVPYTTGMLPALADLPLAPVRPRNAEELKAVQDRVEVIVKYAIPATVNLVMSGAQGSGVIVSKDGHVLTAGHVSGPPGVNLTLRLSNGTRVQGVSLGVNNQLDSGMVKITTPGEYPFVPLGNISQRPAREWAGQWAIALGHPGGFETGRPPVVRLGKVLQVARTNSTWFVQTDCPLIMGDSGGPLFDLDGRLIGINSKIGRSATTNIHVPVDTYTQTWERLARGDQWGTEPGFFARGGRSAEPAAPEPSGASRGIRPSTHELGVAVLSVEPGGPAEARGLRGGDIITRVNGSDVKSPDDITSILKTFRPGAEVTVDFLRDQATRQVRVILQAANR